MSFVDEHRAWRAAGMPVRSKERVAELHETLCKPCQHFKDDHCGVCGCPVNTYAQMWNRLAWATAACPADPPRFVEEPEENRQPAKLWTRAQSAGVSMTPPVIVRKLCGGCGGKSENAT